jgi:hypothetical protein
MFGHVSYFTTPMQRRNERRFHRSRPEDFVTLWGPKENVSRPHGKR